MEQLQSWFQNAPDYYEYSPLFPNPVICLRDMVKVGLQEGPGRLPLNGLRVWLQETMDWLRLTVYLDLGILLYPFIMAVFLTVLRVSLNHLLFYRVPGWFKLNKESTEKFPESIWKCSIYIFTWAWAIYLVLFGERNLFNHLQDHWQFWYPGMPVDPSLRWLYIFQIGFYLHCAYASIYIETIRKDFAVLMLHHFLTIGLLLFSYSVRYHIIGLLVLFIQDIGDIFLELSKTIFYFKIQDGKEHWGPEMGANISFAIFTTQHILFRLYWFPTKVIYSAMYVSMIYYPGGPFWTLFVIMLWTLWGMQVYWFKFIVSLLVKILIYQEKLEDNREYDEEKEKKKKQEGKTKGKDGKKEDGKNRREQKNGPNPQKGDKKEQ